MRKIHWPAHGDERVFHRTLAAYAIIGCAFALAAAGAASMLFPDSLAVITPLAVGTCVLVLLWAHAHAEGSARRREIVKSFADLTVLHHGFAIRIADEPLIGEFDTRRNAANAAMQLGKWAVIVRAYDRYYVLAGRRTQSVRTPVSFRTPAVADIVPAIIDGELISA